MNDFVRLIALALAVRRMTNMAIYEEGPFRLAYTARAEIVMAVQDSPRWNWIAEGMACPYCLSWWFGLIGGLFTPGSPADKLIAGMSAAGIVALSYRFWPGRD